MSFNPTLVRFCPVNTSSTPRPGSSFNPTLVRFCQMALGYSITGETSFNPTLVRFCLPAGTTPSLGDRRFNPTLVRFCLPCGRLCAIGLHAFQSHLGSILPSSVYSSSTFTRTGFQSHLGSILPCRAKLSRRCRTSFQSPPWFDFAAALSRTCTPSVVFHSHLGRFLPAD